MNKKLSASVQWIVTVILGLGALGLRRGLDAWAVDDKGLIREGHICALLLWPVALAAVAVAVFPVKHRRSGSEKVLAAGSLLCALGLLSLLPGAGLKTALDGLWLGALLASVAALVWEAVSRWRGKPVSVLVHGVVCVFLVLHLLTRYQMWCHEPQFVRYLYSLFGCLGILIHSYCRACGDIGKPEPRLFRIVGLLAVFCCLAALPGSDAPGLYLGGGAWVLSGLEGRK